MVSQLWFLVCWSLRLRPPFTEMQPELSCLLEGDAGHLPVPRGTCGQKGPSRWPRTRVAVGTVWLSLIRWGEDPFGSPVSVDVAVEKPVGNSSPAQSDSVSLPALPESFAAEQACL